MALVTCNDVGVISGTIVRPLVGVWTADLVLDQSDAGSFAPGTKVTITSEGGYSLAGVVDPNRSGGFLDAVHVRVVGGAGGMAKAASPRAYVQPSAFVRDVVNGLAKDAGESLSSTSDQGFLSTNLAAWSAMGKSVTWNLRTLLKIVAPAFSWRILSDGTLWIGAESWPSASGTFDAISQNPADGSFDLGVEAPFVAPGTAIDGIGNINRCVDTIEGGQLRTHVYVDLPGEGERGLQASISRMVAQASAGVDYYGLYLFQVVSQSGDLATVDVQPLGDRKQTAARRPAARAGARRGRHQAQIRRQCDRAARLGRRQPREPVHSRRPVERQRAAHPGWRRHRRGPQERPRRRRDDGVRVRRRLGGGHALDHVQPRRRQLAAGARQRQRHADDQREDHRRLEHRGARMSTDYGSDTLWTTDAPLVSIPVTDPFLVVGQRIVRLLQTPRGGLGVIGGDPNRGWDVRQYLLGRMSPARQAQGSRRFRPK
jgi:hypothetical protein